MGGETVVCMEFETFTRIGFPAVDDSVDDAGGVAEGGTHGGTDGATDSDAISELPARLGFCAACAAETPFEQPACPDGHGDLCPEWSCIDCGTAVIVPIGAYLEPVPATSDQIPPAAAAHTEAA